MFKSNRVCPANEYCSLGRTYNPQSSLSPQRNSLFARVLHMGRVSTFVSWELKSCTVFWVLFNLPQSRFLTRVTVFYLFIYFFGLSVILAFESNDCIKHEMCKHLIWCPKWWFANIHISYSDPPFYSIFYIYSRRLTRCLLSAKFCMMELFRQLLISAVWWLIPCSCCSSCCLPWFRGLPWAWKLGIKGSGADWWRQMAPWLVILVTWGSSCVLPGK